MTPRQPLPEELAFAPFTTAEARAAGLGRGRLRGSDLVQPYHGIYTVAAPRDLRERCEALQPLTGPAHLFSHVTAARLWGIPIAQWYHHLEPLHVLTVGGRVALRHHQVAGWVTARADTGREVIGGLAMVDPVEAWCQLAVTGSVVPGQKVPLEWLVAAADFIVTERRIAGIRRPPLATREQLTQAVDARARSRGVRRLAEALEFCRPGAQSPKETILRLRIVWSGLPEPVVQIPVQTAEGLLHADLGYPDARLLIEYQGDEHRTSRRRWLSDLTRAQLFQDAGYTTMFVGADDVAADCRLLLARIRRHLASHS